MLKKGVSPLIATVLIIGFVFVLAAALFPFFTNVINDQTSQVNCEREAKHKCDLIEEVRISPTDNLGNLEFLVSNTNNFPLYYSVSIHDLITNELLFNFPIFLNANSVSNTISTTTTYSNSKIKYTVLINETFEENSCFYTCKEGEIIPQ